MAVSFTITRTTTRFHDSNGNGVQDGGEQGFDFGEIGVYDPGDILYTRIKITNTGNESATGVTVQDVTSGTTPVANPNDAADLSYINISPIASNDSFEAIGNTVLRVGTANTINNGESKFIAGNLTSNDVGSLVGDDIFGFQIDPVTDGVTAKGGTFNIFADGTFNYVNDGNDTQADLAAGDSFTYTIRDKGFDGTYGTADDLTSTATVTITFAEQSAGVPHRVWYVDSNAAPGGDGTSANPFQTMAPLNGAANDGATTGDLDQAGEYIYVENGAGAPVTGPITLENNQILIGDGAALVVAGVTLATAGTNSILTAASGPIVTLGSGNTITGLNIGNGTGSAGGIAGTNFGTLTVNNVAIDVADSALNLATGTFAGAGFTSVNSDGGTSNISLSSVTGNIALGTGALTGASGTNFSVNGGNGDITFNGTIIDDEGQLVRITNRTGGIIDFNGAVGDGFDGDGGVGNSEGSIHLGDNTGGTVRFDGGISLSTGSNDALTSLNSAGSTATLVITDPASGSNRITTTAGQAIDVQHTTIGSGGLVFESVNVNGAGVGINLHTTGSTAGLSVTGTGAAGSGGTIQNTGQGATFTSTSNVSLTNMNFTNANGAEGNVSNVDSASSNANATAAIKMSSVTTATFTGLAINGNGGLGGQQLAINGNVVSGFTLASSTISGHGDEAGEGGMRFWNLTGTANITNSTFSFAGSDTTAGENHIDIRNGTGTSLTLNMSGNTFETTRTSNSGSGGLMLTTVGGATATANIVNNDFNGMKTSGIEVFARDSSILNVNITNGGTVGNHNIFNRQGGLSRGIGLNAEDTAQLNFNVTNNTISGSGGPIINMFSINDAQVMGRINGNTITGGGAGAAGSAIFVHAEDHSNAIVEILNNVILSNGQDAGISVTSVGDGPGPSTDNSTLDVVIAHNNITMTNNEANGGAIGIDVRAGANDGEITKTAAYVHHNTITTGGASDYGFLARIGSNDSFLYLQGSVAGGDNNTRANSNWTANSNTETGPGSGAVSLDAGGSPAYTNPPGGAPYNGVVRSPTHPTAPMLAEAPPPAQPADDSAAPAPAADNDGPAPAPVAAGPVVVDDGVISQAELDLILEAAIQRWVAAGATEEQVDAMRAVEVTVADLGGLTLGSSGLGTIVLDSDAAGWRWFVDSTPGDDSEYAGSGTSLAAVNPLGMAGTRIDLLTVITHELGHQIGLSDSYAAGDSDELMYGTIGAGQRRLPGSDDLSHAADAPVTGAFAFAPITLGTIPAGQTVTVEYRQTIDSPGEDRLVGSWTGQSFVDSDQTVAELSNAEGGNVDGLTLGDRIFNDNNKNGLYDAGDSTFAGVVLTLYADTNNNGSYDEGVDLHIGYNNVNATPGYQQGVDTPAAPGTGTPLTATTNATGHYSFSNLAPGDYIVRVDASNFQSSGALFGRVSTPGVKDPNDTNADGDSNVAAPADLNVDNDDNGEQFLTGQAGTYAASRAIRLDYGQETVAGPTGPALDTNNSLDLAFFAPNKAPTSTNLQGDVATFTENLPEVALDAGFNLTIADPDSANFGGGSLVVKVTTNKVATEDQLFFSATPGVGGPGAGYTAASGNLYYNGVLFATYTAGGVGADRTFSFNNNATPEIVQGLMRGLYYFNANTIDPSTATRTIEYVLVDGDGTDGGLGTDTLTLTSTVNVVAVNDAPDGGAGNSDSTNDVTVLTFDQNDFQTGFSDPDHHSFNGIVITGLPSAGTLKLNGTAITTTPQTVTLADLTGGKLTYEPAAGSSGQSPTFKYAVRDNGGVLNGGIDTDPSESTFTITIAASNTAPTLDLDANDSRAAGTGYAEPYSEGGAPAAIADIDAVITDADSGDMIEGATIAVTSPVSGDVLAVAGTLPGSITVDAANSTPTTLVLTGTGTQAQYAAALGQITFENTSDDPTAKGTRPTRSVTVTVTDGSASSNTATTTITITDVNDAPAGTSSTITAVEDTHRTLSGSDFGIVDADGVLGSVTISAVGGGGIYYDADGAGNASTPQLRTLPETFTAQDLADGKVSFKANQDLNGTGVGTITFTVADDDGAAAAASNVLTVNVTPTNDSPVLTTPGPVAATEQTAVQLLPAGSVSDTDLDALNNGNGDYAGAQFSVNRNSAASTDDVFTLVAGPNFTIDGINLKTTGGQIFATISANNPGLLVINFTSSQAIATSALVDEVIQAVRYTNASDNPPASVELAVGFTDGSPNAVQGGGASGLDVNLVTVNITGTNDAPVLDLNGAAAGSGATLAFSEGHGNTRIAPDATVSDIDSADFAGGTLVVDLTKVGTGDYITILDGNGITVDNGTQKVSYNGVEIASYAITNLAGTYTFTFNSAATAAAVQAVVRQVAFANQNDNQLSGDRTVSYTLTDGDGGTSNVATATVSVTAVDDAPVAQPDTVSTPENAVGTGSLLSDNGSGADTDAEGDPITISAVSFGTVGVPFEFASGAIVTVNSDGTYSINPNGKYNKLTDSSSGAVNTEASETFTYTVTGGNTVSVTVRVTGVAGPGDELHGNSSDNTINGTPNGDVFILHQGGNDTANGLAGNDLFIFRAALTSQDKVNGGEGRDQIAIQGQYTGGNALTLGTGVVNVESFVLVPGNNTNRGDPGTSEYSYHVTTVNENVGTGQVMTFDGAQLRANENFTFRGAAETDGAFRVIGGLGTDDLVGGSQSDVFLFNDGAFGTNDVVDGGAGTARDQLALRGDFSFLMFGAGQLTSIESLVLLSGHDVPQNTDYDYTIQMHDNNLIGGSMTVDAAQLRSDETFNFFGQNESDGIFRISGGAGDDQILGGQLGDRIRGNGGNDNLYGREGADEIWGGAGDDRFAYDSTTHSNAAATDKIMDFTTGDNIALNTIDANSGVAGDQAFTFIGSAAFTPGTAGQLRVVQDPVQAGHWFVLGDVNGDAQADLVIEVYTTDLQPLDATDFTL